MASLCSPPGPEARSWPACRAHAIGHCPLTFLYSPPDRLKRGRGRTLCGGRSTACGWVNFDRAPPPTLPTAYLRYGEARNTDKQSTLSLQHLQHHHPARPGLMLDQHRRSAAGSSKQTAMGGR